MKFCTLRRILQGRHRIFLRIGKRPSFRILGMSSFTRLLIFEIDRYISACVVISAVVCFLRAVATVWKRFSGESKRFWTKFLKIGGIFKREYRIFLTTFLRLEDIQVLEFYGRRCLRLRCWKLTQISPTPINVACFERALGKNEGRFARELKRLWVKVRGICRISKEKRKKGTKSKSVQTVEFSTKLLSVSKESCLVSRSSNRVSQVPKKPNPT